MAELSYLRISGTPFEVGYALGQFGLAAVHNHLMPAPAWASVMKWRSSAKADTMASLVRERFPRVWAELQGLAKGLALPFEDVFLWNCRGDLWAMAPDGCTTVQMPGRETRRITHNEDGYPGFAGYCAIAECRTDGCSGFAAFVYPGSLPGHTFAVTNSGLVVAVNNLRKLAVSVGVPRMVLTRGLLEASSLQAAVDLLHAEPRAGGFHLTLAHRDCDDLLSVEFSSNVCSVHPVETQALHANHAIHPALRDMPQIITESSKQRQLRGDALLTEVAHVGGAADPLAILGDTDNTAFPIYRDSDADSDEENTLATADITVRSTHIHWQVYEHPRHPARFRMIDGHAQEQPAFGLTKT